MYRMHEKTHKVIVNKPFDDITKFTYSKSEGANQNYIHKKLTSD